MIDNNNMDWRKFNGMQANLTPQDSHVYVRVYNWMSIKVMLTAVMAVDE